MFPMMEPVKSCSPLQTEVSKLLGVKNPSLSGVTPSASTAAANSPMLPSHASPVNMTDIATPASAVITEESTLETAASQVVSAHSKNLHMDYPLQSLK